MFISSHFSLNCIFDKMQPGVEDQLIKLLIETQKHDPVKIFNFDIQTNVRKGLLLKYQQSTVSASHGPSSVMQ